MKALVYTGPETCEYRNASDPSPAPGEALLRVSHVGICGSDMHAYLGHDERRPAPLILGHEVSATVIAGQNPGSRVTVNPLVTCGKCEACLSGRDNLCQYRQIISMPPREGGFADYLAMPEQNLVIIPDHVTEAQAALTEPIACGWHAVRLARRHLEGDLSDVRALVLGGGAIGVGAALSLKAQGFTQVHLVEPNTMRGDYLRKTCAFDVLNEVDPSKDGSFDVVIDGVGYAQTRSVASQIAKPGGVILHIGLGSAEGGLNIRRMTLQEITFIGTYTYTSADFIETAEAIFAGRLGSLEWVDTRSLSEGAQAFAELRRGEVSAPKVLLRP